MKQMIDSPCIFAIFGGTGDLTHRKLVPAVYQLAVEEMLPEHFIVVGIGRRAKTNEEYRTELLESVTKYSRFKMYPEIWEKVSGRIFYYQLDFPDEQAYSGLKEYLDEMDQVWHTAGNRIFYLSVAPNFFDMITLSLKKHDMAPNKDSWQRLVIEKPFGRDLVTAQHLNAAITEVFPEENIFRIDHYLGKEMLQNMLVIRFGNVVFESIWNSKYIESIQITSGETVGVESRAGYYESSGALRDMVQNHLLQLLALVAMEAPASIDARSIREEKVKLLRSMNKIGPANVHGSVIRGQYGSGPANGNGPANGSGTQEEKILPGYRQEAGVSEDSDTETYVAMHLTIGNFRWGNTPFYLRTGKRMPEKNTYIVIEFKSLPGILYFKEYSGMLPNMLEIKIQPEEGISFRFNTKKPSINNEITSVDMDFCQNCEFATNTPEAYERLIADIMKNDQTLFTSWEEIETSWSFIDSITTEWKNARPQFPNYESGTWGPAEADELLANNGHKWWEPWHR